MSIPQVYLVDLDKLNTLAGVGVEGTSGTQSKIYVTCVFAWLEDVIVILCSCLEGPRCFLGLIVPCHQRENINLIWCKINRLKDSPVAKVWTHLLL